MERESDDATKPSVGLQHHWQKRDSLVFRIFHDSGVFTLSSSHEVVDVKLNEAALRELSESESLGDNIDVITMHWDTWEGPCCSSFCEVHFHKNSKTKLRTAVLDLMRDGFHQLQSLVETIFREYTTRITYVRINPFAIGLIHHNLKDFKRMKVDVENLQNILRNLFSKYSNCDTELHVQLHLCDNADEGSDEDSPNTSDGISLDSERKHDGRILPISKKEEEHFQAGDEREKKFRQIEGSLKAQRHNIESKFQEQRKQNEEMNMKLQSLLESIQVLPGLGKVQTPIAHAISSPHSLGTHVQSKYRNSATDDKKLIVEDSMKVPNASSESCLPETFVGYTHRTEGSSADNGNIEEFTNAVGDECRAQVSSDDLPPNEDLSEHITFQRQPMQPADFYQYLANWNSNLKLSELPYEKVPRTANFETDQRAPPVMMKNHPKKSGSPQEKGNYKYVEGAYSTENQPQQTKITRGPGIALGFLGAHGVTVDSPETRRLMRTVEEAMMDDDPMPLKARALDTILCLDTSSSMGVAGLKEMKEIAISFVDGIEDVASQYEREENIAVVTFGGHSKIAHHLSNDYSSVRNTIENAELGGRSPLFEALMVCLCSINGRGGVMNIFGVHHVTPRLIIITDGKASDESEGSTDVENCPMDVKMRIVQLLRDFGSKGSNTFPKPVVWIPAGRADKSFINSLARISNGKFLDGHQVRKLCNYQRIQITVAEMFVYLQNENPTDMLNFEDHIDTLLGVMATNLDRDEKNEVLETLKAKLEGKPGFGNPSSDPDSFDDVHEDAGLPPLGTRVTRGKDWVWENQDSEGPGTVVNHAEQKGSNIGLLWVLWDNGTRNQYRYGQNYAYDVKEAPDQPRNTSGDIEVGCEVTRGPDWKEEYGEQDGGHDGVGVVINKKSGMVQVRWRRNCYIGSYRYDRQGAKDLSVRDPIQCLLDLTKENTERQDVQPRSRIKVRSHEKGSWIWKWQSGDHKWHEYPDEVNKKLEEAYTVRRERSCLIRKNGKSSRVLFKDMHEKDLEDQTRRQVARVQKKN